MADNTTLPGTGEVYAADDRGGVKFQKVLTEPLNGPSVDAFQRLRVSNPHTLFDYKFLGLDKMPLFWDEVLESGAGITSSTPDAFKPYLDVTSTLNTAGVFTRQTFRAFNYQPGKSDLIVMTGVLNLSGGGTGVQRRLGLFNDANGCFFEDDAGTIGVTLRSSDSGSPVDTTVTQANWNVDTMDGGDDASNPSGILVDWTKGQIFHIDFQWLSLGRVRFGLEINGMIQYVHEFNSANSSSIPWASTPNLPVRYQMITTGSSPASKMRLICAMVVSEGGVNPKGLTMSHATTDHVNANAADTVYALLGLRLKSTHTGATIEPTNISVIAESKQAFEWRLIHNATVAGTFNFSDLTNSAVQLATGDTASPSTNTVTGGTIIARGFTGEKDTITVNADNSLTPGVAIDGTLDTLVLAARPLAINADIQGAITWREMM